MPNPILRYSPQPVQSNPVRDMYNAYKNVGNPNMFLQQMAQNNPQFAQVMQMCRNQNPKDLFYAMCQQSGVDPNTILNQLK